jgi:hypothetical protein
MKGFLKNYKVLKVDLIDNAPWNYKEQDKFMQGQLVENIKTNGQVESVIVRQMDDGRYEMVNGNHRLDAFRELKIKEVMCYDLGIVEEALAVRIAIETNETRFKSDHLKLAALIERTAQEFSVEDLMKTMPYKKPEIENMVGLLKFNFEDQPPTTLPPEIGESIESPQLGNNDDKKHSGATVEHSIPDSRTLNLKLPSEVAEQFEYQINRIKKLMYPDELPERVAITLPLQAMLQIVAGANDSAFK